VPSDQENPDQGNSRQVGTFREKSEVRWRATSPQVQFDRNTVLIASTMMSLMQAQRQEYLKYPASTLLKSSNDLGWSTLTAELRSHSAYVVFQMAEVAIPRQMFQEILRLIAELRPQPPPAPA
jgi:hypothetical protein